MALQVTTFCCGVADLEKGSIISAIILIILNVFLLAFSCVTKPALAFGIVLAIFGIIAAVVLIIGAIQKEPWCLFVWMVLTALLVLLLFIDFIVLLAVDNDTLHWIDYTLYLGLPTWVLIIQLILVLAIMSLDCYFLVVVYSLFIHIGGMSIFGRPAK